jgi:hypothetical protein
MFQKEKVLSNGTEVVGGASLNPGLAVTAYSEKLSILHYGSVLIFVYILRS